MSEENINQEFCPKNIDETRNYLIGEIYQNELTSKKHKKFIEVWLILSPYINFSVTGWVSVCCFAYLVGIPIGITSSVKGLKIYVITAGIKKYK